MLPMLSRRTAVFEFEIERNCKPNIRSENDVGGVGVSLLSLSASMNSPIFVPANKLQTAAPSSLPQF